MQIKRSGKAPTGIAGLDEILGGGLPSGRATLLVGGPGSGKTVLSLEFIARGAIESGEHGAFISFEQPVADLEGDVAGFGWDVPSLIGRRLLHLRHIPVRAFETIEVGDYDLTGLLVQIDAAIATVSASRVVLDGIDNLLSGFGNERVVRAEIGRLLDGLRSRGVTTVFTAGRGELAGTTRHGLAEYLSDCVLLLDNRIDQQVSTRRLRVLKYRGSSHGADEYPILIGPTGVILHPLTGIHLDHGATNERIPSGVLSLDAMFEGSGYFRGSTVLISGTAGTGKTSLLSSMADAACARGETAMVFSFEESGAQIVRNMRSIGLDLQRWIDARLLHIVSVRPSRHGLENHVVEIQNLVGQSRPSLVILDPVSGFSSLGSTHQIASMLARLASYFRSKGATTVMSVLADTQDQGSCLGLGISSVADTWLRLTSRETLLNRETYLSVIKSRGMAHSTRTKILQFSRAGLALASPQDAPASTGGVV